MILLRFTRHLYRQIYNDLTSPHPFAAERVGFLFARVGALEGKSRLILLTSYYPIPDNQYIDDPLVGARINSEAIRTIIQYIMNTGEGCFHVHMHEHQGRPWFSKIDLSELPLIIRPFQTVGVNTAHGALLLSHNDITGLAWLPEDKEPRALSKISIIGYPTELFDLRGEYAK